MTHAATTGGPATADPAAPARATEPTNASDDGGTADEIAAAQAATIDMYLDAYGETDGERRAMLIDCVFAQDGELIDPPLDARGRAAISEMAATVQGLFPGHHFRRTTALDAHHDVARYGWELLDPEGTAVLAGTDIAEMDGEGRLRRVTGFFGPLTPLA